jgi:hypothetical protein
VHENQSKKGKRPTLMLTDAIFTPGVFEQKKDFSRAERGPKYKQLLLSRWLSGKLGMI